MGVPGFMSHSGFARNVRGGFGLHHQTRPFTRGIYPGSPFLFSDYDPAEPYLVESAPPQVVVVQPPAADDFPRKNRPGPLLIELQGDRYVRFGGADATGERELSSHPGYVGSAIAKPLSLPRKEPAQSATGELHPTVLVYRDGHREEIPDYTIADGEIYVGGNYWQNGYWTKHIALSALDPAATVEANQQRGVRFMLPSAPNVVIASF
jgi:hypothetical protein